MKHWTTYKQEYDVVAAQLAISRTTLMEVTQDLLRAEIKTQELHNENVWLQALIDRHNDECRECTVIE